MTNGNKPEYKRCFMRAMPGFDNAGRLVQMMYPGCPQTNEPPEKTILGPPKDYCELWVPRAGMCYFEWMARQENIKVILPDNFTTPGIKR